MKQSVLRPIVAQTGVEVRLTLRRGEQVLVTLLIPAAVLVAVSGMAAPPAGYRQTVDFLLPGVLTLAVMATGMVSLAIATGYERFYRVLKRLGVTPLSRLDLLVAKLGGVLVIELLQVGLLAALAAALLGWRPAGTAWAAAPLLALGSACFVGLGLLMAGTLRAEVTLSVANVLYLVFAALGGIVAPRDRLPDWLAGAVRVLPVTAMGRALRAVLAQGAAPSGVDVLVLLAWTAAAVLLAARTFRWE